MIQLQIYIGWKKVRLNNNNHIEGYLFVSVNVFIPFAVALLAERKIKSQRENPVLTCVLYHY